MVHEFAKLLADRSRGSILYGLLDGRARTAGELARLANISPQNASMHLRKLTTAGMLRQMPSGRHIYYQLLKPEVAEAFEFLEFGAAHREFPKKKHATGGIEFARTCYDHAAGRLAVMVADALVKKRLLDSADHDFAVTAKGAVFLCGWGIDVKQLAIGQRMLTRACLDWTERRFHLAGALGAALLRTFLERKWVLRSREPRLLRVTYEGKVVLNRELSLSL
jgi:DNA-binding transcriptional ArsR family regulator